MLPSSPIRPSSMPMQPAAPPACDLDPAPATGDESTARGKRAVPAAPDGRRTRATGSCGQWRSCFEPTN